MRMLRGSRRQGAAQWLKGADGRRSPPGRGQAQRQRKQGDGGGYRERRGEGRRREGPQKEGGPGTGEEAGRRAGAPGPEGEGAALSPESARALPGRGPGAQVYQLGRPRRLARGQALLPVPAGRPLPGARRHRAASAGTGRARCAGPSPGARRPLRRRFCPGPTARVWPGGTQVPCWRP